jgi:hypothetical protein
LLACRGVWPNASRDATGVAKRCVQAGSRGMDLLWTSSSIG